MLFLNAQVYLAIDVYLLELKMANLAVIGAGIGGCCAAYFARKYFSDLDVTIYDDQNRIGGRILTYKTAGVNLELGATFFNSFNRTMADIINTERLKIIPVEERGDFAVWNGSEFIFKSSKQSFATNLKLLSKYKQSLTRTVLLLREAKKQVAKLYEEELKNPADIGEIFKSAELDQWYKKSFSEILTEKGVNQDFIDEIITPITRIIYSQNADIGGFAGISTLIGVYSGTTYSLDEGNNSLPVHLVKVSNAQVRLNQKVDKIEKTSDGAYKVCTGKDSTVFDKVIIATPLELADIEFEGVSVPRIEPQAYQTVYKKIMKGIFNPDYFSLKNSAEFPAMVLTTKDANPIIHYSIQKIDSKETMITIASTEPLTAKTFDGIFKNEGTEILEYTWEAAYPKFKPLAKLPPTYLDNRLIYTSAVEPAASSMETSALSALNAIRLL